MFYLRLQKILTPEISGVSRDEIASLRSTFAKIRQMVRRLDEYNQATAGNDYLAQRDAAIASGDVEALEELGDMDSFRKRYAGISESLWLALTKFQETAHIPHLPMINRCVAALAKIVGERETLEKQFADSVGTSFEPSSGVKALRKQLQRCYEHLDMVEAKKSHFDLRGFVQGIVEDESELQLEG